VGGSIGLLERPDVGEEVLNVLAAEAQVRHGRVRIGHSDLSLRFVRLLSRLVRRRDRGIRSRPGRE
jgi:hypothetical protein